ncbi:hypothetical protein [Halobacteriovorax sp. HLS]|uniref:hypothetical protein n=1 Tax=Halobacteriovorax sp. HLS TaxID=2234000 RepID=UPI000FDAB2A3|nr:hypothetical protein [Halobacteriovorax sp. HLS]
MKKVFTFIMKPKVDHLALTEISQNPGVKYIMDSSLVGLRSSIENIGRPDIILTDTNSMALLSEISDLENVEKKIILCPNEQANSEIDYIEISKIDEYINSFLNLGRSFEKIPLNFFYSMEKASVDIFIRLQKQGQSKFILRYAKNDIIELSDLTSYSEKGMVDLYVKSTDKDELYNMLSNSLCYEIGVNDSLDAMKNGLELSRSLFLESGYTPCSIQLIEELNTSLFNRLEQEASSSSEAELLQSILSSKDSLYYKKVALQMILGMDILKKEDWSMDRHFELYSFISLFADIALTDTKMGLISTDDEYDKSKFDEMDAEILENHALLAFELLANYEARPINVDLLILEHHGMKSGIGFSKNIGVGLNKIVVIFRIAENIAIEMLKKEESGKSFFMDEILDLVEKKFDSPRTRKILDQLELSI